MKKEMFHVAGDILNADCVDIAQALSPLPYVVRVKNMAEVQVERDGFDMEIYSYQESDSGKYNFLVGGNMDGVKDGVIITIKQIAEQLEIKSIVYNFEVYPKNNPDDCTVIRHKNF